MRLWRVVVLMFVALLVGIALGYVRWGREARQLREAAALLPPEVRQRAADPGRRTAQGIVRLILRDQAVVFLTHEAIPGVMPGATRAFSVASPKLLDVLTPGDPVRFTLERRGMQSVVVAIERDKRSAP